MKIKVSDYLAAFLKEQGVTHVFELVGGMITFLIDSIHTEGGIKIVSVHHEQGAAFAAEGFGRATGVPGVALATSGPGATNLLTGIGSCYFDSTPAVFITGQVNRHEMKGDLPIRQLGFQETDIVSMAKPITKAAWQATDPAQIPDLLRRAFALALEGRPGPVLVDIPMDVQRAEIEAEAPVKVQAPAISSDEGLDAFAGDLLARLRSAERPLILAGGGIRVSGTHEAFLRFVERAGVPVVHSLMGVDLLPYSSPYRFGMIGSYGNRYANHAISRSDFLVVLGSRLDVRQTGADTASFKSERTIYHLDCEAGELNNRVKGCVTHTATLRDFFAAVERLSPEKGAPRAKWLAELDALKLQSPDDREYSGANINPNRLMHQLSAVSGAAAGFVADVGQHQMWAAQSLRLGAGQRFLTSGGMGSMGFALPAAIGFAFGAGKPAVVIAGDGGFQCNIQELQTVARNDLPVKVVILNNRCHGMVRQFQESYFKGRYASTLWGYDAPDFVAVGNAYGIPSRLLAEEGDAEAALAWLWENPQEPALLEVAIESHGNVYPKMAFGRPIHEMEPLVKPTEMEGT